ncbi:hypothetical protein LEP1GSC061_0122 [Leptospira wolffii serovar Khorat str. Khorat-H2]|nr:hypothetical protein LEP1GSC061_0122 [Leptospira wolffii serovar Khorat str. Khorat-H2]
MRLGLHRFHFYVPSANNSEDKSNLLDIFLLYLDTALFLSRRVLYLRSFFSYFKQFLVAGFAKRF